MRKIASLLAAAALFAAVPAHAETKYNLVWYGWLTGLEGEMGIGDAATFPVTASFEELLDYVDFASAVHFEAQEPRAVLITDVAYFNLGAEREAMVRNSTVNIDMDLQEWVFELGGGYRITPELDLILAGRWYVLDFGADSTSPWGSSNLDNTHDWGDIYAGARYTTSFMEKWTVSARADVGTGGSELALFGNLLVAYRFTDLISAGIGWRGLSLERKPDRDNGDYLLYDMTQDGAGIGVGFTF